MSASCPWAPAASPFPVLLDAAAWAETTFGACALGDARRTRRLVQVASQLAAAPAASLPAALGDPAQLKAAYRLLHTDAVTVAALTAPHRAQTQQAARAPGVTLLIQDTTELDYTAHRATRDVGPIGNGRGRGYLLHSTLAVRPDGTVLGLAHLHPFVRTPAPERIAGTPATRAADRRHRPRESDVWAEAVQAVGSPPRGATWVHIADRGGDVFTFLAAGRDAGTQMLVRVAQDRRATTPDGIATHVRQAARALPAVATRPLAIAAAPGRPARTAQLSLAWTPLTVQPPADVQDAAPLSGWVVRGWEADPPAEGEPVEWVLLTTVPVTTVPVTTVADGWERVDWYARRWLVEEYHRGLKTGCRIEASQLRDRDALWRLLGLCVPTAERLLQLRHLARTDPDQPATAVLPPEVVAVVAAKTGQPAAGMTVGSGCRLIARLGGHQGRRGDGPPGWETLWRGWQIVTLLVEGMRLAASLPDP